MKLLSFLAPFLFALFPILFLYSKNANEFPPSVLIGPVLISIAITGLLIIASRIFSKNRFKIGWVISLLAFFFFSYGHFFHFLETRELLRARFLGNLSILLSIYGVIVFSIIALTLKFIQNWESATGSAGMFALIMTAITAAQIVYGFDSRSSNDAGTLPENKSTAVTANPELLPNIYYIILDGYPRDDVVQRIHHYDNSDFTDFLRENGFFVAEKSRSNYSGTAVSLSSSLNRDYLQKLLPQISSQESNRWPLTQLIKNNSTGAFLKERGYTTIAIASGYFPTEIRNAGRFIATGWMSNEFHDALIDTTPAPVLLKNLRRFSIQRKRILDILDEIPRAAAPDSPVFVFAHLMALHPPFVFDSNGEEVQREKSSLQFWKEFGKDSDKKESAQYTAQLTFINKKMKAVVNAILSRPGRPSIIILQGDHGSSFLTQGEVTDAEFYRERFSILNAIYIPSGLKITIPDSLTPVNTFRILLQSLFQLQETPLPDKNYFSRREKPYHWIDVTGSIP